MQTPQLADAAGELLLYCVRWELSGIPPENQHPKEPTNEAPCDETNRVWNQPCRNDDGLFIIVPDGLSPQIAAVVWNG
jgi:hypothetical protein